MSRQQQVLELAREKGIIRAEDVEAVGISRNYLYRMHNEGLLEKNAVGLYTLPEAPVTENSSLAEVAKRLPHAVVCLISALSYHEITTQIPHEIWLTIPRGSWRPDVEYPPLNLMINVNYFSRPATIKIPVSCLFQREAGDPSCSRLPRLSYT
ncbi:MAG: type IV toxin-antitoxin system AbiEi family antitoxin domain-containing protein [Trichloromonas sp.]|nr:type IV toxin-antitoxin system AbiEi family antitoxin domain-containing protein [Trichloromonas sp.]